MELTPASCGGKHEGRTKVISFFLFWFAVGIGVEAATIGLLSAAVAIYRRTRRH